MARRKCDMEDLPVASTGTCTQAIEWIDTHTQCAAGTLIMHFNYALTFGSNSLSSVTQVLKAKCKKNTCCYRAGRKCALIRLPMKTTARIAGVRKPHTGHRPKIKHSVQISPTTVAVGIIRGQYTAHSK